MISVNKSFPFIITIGTVLLNGCPNQTAVPEEMAQESQVTKEKKRGDKWLAQQASFEEKRKEGVDFYAFGAESSWSASIDATRSVKFTSGKDIDLMSEGPSAGIRPADLNAIVYRAALGKESIVLSAYPDSCTDLSTGELFPYKVTGTYRSAAGEISSYMGCGLFLTDPALNDIYVLRSWSAYEDLRKEFSRDMPRIELHFQNNTIIGFDGRCEFFGKFEPMGDRLFIYELDFQDEKCRGDNRSPFFDHINVKEHLFQLEGGQLRLINGRDVLTFAKAD